MPTGARRPIASRRATCGVPQSGSPAASEILYPGMGTGIGCRPTRCVQGQERILPTDGVQDLAAQGSILDRGRIEAEIIAMLSGRVPSGVQVLADTQIVRGLGLDSVAILDFIMDLEDRFDVSIPLDRVAEVQTIAELSGAIEALMRAPA